MPRGSETLRAEFICPYGPGQRRRGLKNSILAVYRRKFTDPIILNIIPEATRGRVDSTYRFLTDLTDLINTHMNLEDY